MPIAAAAAAPCLQAAVLLSVCWLNAMLTGVAFCGPSCNDVAVMAYDTEELRVWRRS